MIDNVAPEKFKSKLPFEFPSLMDTLLQNSM